MLLHFSQWVFCIINLHIRPVHSGQDRPHAFLHIPLQGCDPVPTIDGVRATYPHTQPASSVSLLRTCLSSLRGFEVVCLSPECFHHVLHFHVFSPSLLCWAHSTCFRHMVCQVSHMCHGLIPQLLVIQPSSCSPQQ